MHGLLRVIAYEDVDGSQRVVDKVGPDLLDHRMNLCLAQLRLLLDEQPLLKDRSAHEADAPEDEIGR